MTHARLIEAAFPLEQASLASVHEKNVRHGHISTLHIWPARRPLAACRAALLAALLPDPGNAGKRRALLARIAGRATGYGESETAAGGVLRWGCESGPELAKLRADVRAAFGGRAPRVLDPFAGGGAIPLEAMRLGCEVAAADINPVAWFLLRLTLHYPRLVAGETLPLPAWALAERAFAEEFVKARGAKTPGAVGKALARLGHSGGDPAQTVSPHLEGDAPPRAGFAWHVRARARRVLAGARRALARRYPTYAEFEPVRRKGRRRADAPPEPRYRPRPPRLLEPDEQGRVSADALNAEFDPEYLEDETAPRWVAKPPVAYLWARTVRCANCRAEIPLLKTLWLCRKGNKRVLLTMTPRADGSGVEFGVRRSVAEAESGAGTMSRSGARCPCCGLIATMEDLRMEGAAGRLGARMTAVVVNGQLGKEYRLPTEEEIAAARVGEEEIEALSEDIPFGVPNEPTPRSGQGASRAFSVAGYGLRRWRDLFTNRQLLTLGTFVREIRDSSETERDYPDAWREALMAYSCCMLGKLADYSSALCSWHNSGEKLGHTFARFALPIVWDYCEVNPFADTTGGFSGMADWVARFAEHAEQATGEAPEPSVFCSSAAEAPPGNFDVICTDPPYYDAIPYSDLMDFFHVWLRRTLRGLSPETDAAFAGALGPKWDADANDGELIDDASRFGGNRAASRKNYEDGMARCFARFGDALRADGRLIVVFANKRPEAWETLVSALIRAGFAVTGSWPVRTEMQNRQRSLASAALSSSIWLVCRKRPASAGGGWDTRVLEEMRANITGQLRDFWDAGIRGPDFVWAATGPALEAFSRYRAVRITDSPRNERLTVGEFLRQVRRMVVGFAVSRLLGGEGGAAEDLDDPTTYYLMHRNDFGLEPAPAGACILYALSCNLSDTALAGRLGLPARGRSGGELRLRPWDSRPARNLGAPAPDGAPPPLIDRLHRTMQLWRAGDLAAVDAWIDARGLRRHELFARLAQALTELAPPASGERALLESILNHLRPRRPEPPPPPRLDLETAR